MPNRSSDKSNVYLTGQLIPKTNRNNLGVEASFSFNEQSYKPRDVACVIESDRHNSHYA